MTRAAWTAALMTFGVANGPIALAQVPDLVLADGQRIATERRAWSELTAPRWTAGDAPSDVGDIAYWGAVAERGDASCIVLRDGSLLAADLLELTETSLRYGLAPFQFGDLPIWRDADIPRRDVAGILLTGDGRGTSWGAAMAAGRRTDIAVLTNGDRVTGSVRFAPPKTDGSEQRGGFQVRFGETTLHPDVDRVAAILLAGAKTDLQGGTWLGFRDGSLVRAESMDADEQQVTLRLTGSVRVSLSRGDFERALCYYEPTHARVVRATDAAPLSYRHRTFFEGDPVIPLRVDRSANNTPLRVAGVRRRWGWGMPAAARMALETPTGAESFVFEAGLDDSAGGLGSATVRVFLQVEDNRWRPAAQSKVLRGGDPPETLRVELRGAQRIAIVTSTADRGEVGDCVDLIAPRFVLRR